MFIQIIYLMFFLIVAISAWLSFGRLKYDAIRGAKRLLQYSVCVCTFKLQCVCMCFLCSILKIQIIHIF